MPTTWWPTHTLDTDAIPFGTLANILVGLGVALLFSKQKNKSKISPKTYPLQYYLGMPEK